MKNSLVTLLLKRFHLLVFAFTFGIFLLLPAGLPEISHACACCSNEGEWYERKETLKSYEPEILNTLKFSPKVSVYEMAEMPGLPDAFRFSDLTVSLTRQSSQWIFLIKTNKGERGTLVCKLPTFATAFGADLHEGRTSNGGGPLLYKELRLESKVSGTGIFAKSLKPDARFRLVLQGRGNNCLMAEDFRNWNLRIYGKQVDFIMYGAMQKSLPQK